MAFLFDTSPIGAPHWRQICCQVYWIRKDKCSDVMVSRFPSLLLIHDISTIDTWKRSDISPGLWEEANSRTHTHTHTVRVLRAACVVILWLHFGKPPYHKILAWIYCLNLSRHNARYTFPRRHFERNKQGGWWCRQKVSSGLQYRDLINPHPPQPPVYDLRTGKVELLLLVLFPPKYLSLFYIASKGASSVAQ